MFLVSKTNLFNDVICLHVTNVTRVGGYTQKTAGRRAVSDTQCRSHSTDDQRNQTEGEFFTFSLLNGPHLFSAKKNKEKVSSSSAID